MAEEELKIKFDHIQGIFDCCINHASQVITDNITSKSLYFDEEQADKLERQEYVRAAGELVQLYIHYSVLDDIPYFYSASGFFWGSGFCESLKSDEKRKYMSFSPLSFDCSQYERDSTIHDEELPYFPVVVKAIVLERYSAYLRRKKESKVRAEIQPQQEESQPIQDRHQEPKIIFRITEAENPFKSILNDRQITLLVDCINEVKIFNAPIAFENLKAIPSCKPKVILKSDSNRQVAFLFSELSNHGLITPN